MSAFATTTELRKMSPQELQREIGEKQGVVSKLRLAVRMQSEKDTAKLRKERLYLARLLTIQHEKMTSGTDNAELKDAPKASRVAAPVKRGKKSSSSK